MTGDLNSYWLRPFLARLGAGETGNVAYLGGSITRGQNASPQSEMGWQMLTARWINEQFPASNLSHINMGVGGTSSWVALATQIDEVIALNPIAIFLDYAVNDTGEFGLGDRSLGFSTVPEAMIRRLRAALPNATLITTIFTWPDDYPDMNDSRRAARDEWRRMARHYAMPLFEIADEMHFSSYADYFDDGNVHPNSHGHAVFFDLLRQYINPEAVTPFTAKTWSASLPKRLYTESHDFEQSPTIVNGCCLTFESGTWHVADDSISSDIVGATIAYTGEFCSFGLDCIVGAEQGVLAWSIDGGGWQSRNLGNEKTAVNAVWNFERGSHTLRLKVVSGWVTVNRVLVI